jgi:hypothetical protein
MVTSVMAPGCRPLSAASTRALGRVKFDSVPFIGHCLRRMSAAHRRSRLLRSPAPLQEVILLSSTLVLDLSQAAVLVVKEAADARRGHLRLCTREQAVNKYGQTPHEDGGHDRVLILPIRLRHVHSGRC